MNEFNDFNPSYLEQLTAQRKQENARKAAQKASSKDKVFCVLKRIALVFFTFLGIVLVGAVLLVNLVFNGPSTAARDLATMAMLESSGMKWFPGLFIGQDKVDEISKTVQSELPAEESNTNLVNIDLTGGLMGSTEWEGHPDGIYIKQVKGSTYTAHVMVIRNPAQVYLATSSDNFSTSIPGTRINHQIETEDAIAAINAGAFYDNGTSSPVVGSVPQGLVISDGKVVWTDGAPPQQGFVGFNQDNILVVAKSMTAAKAMELGIRDGCCFGPVLVMNGEPNQEAYNSNSGVNPRTALGQRADGAVLFVCIDGRQAGSLGGTYADIIDIMVEFGAVNACNLDGGSSTVMLYRDHETGEVSMVNTYSLLQEEPRRMPTFFMVRPASEEE